MQIVPTNNQIIQQISQTDQSQTQQKPVQSKQIQAVVQQPKLVIQSQSTANQQSQAVLTSSIEKSLLQGQPPGTIIKCVTAEVTKNQNGPCIKLTGIQGSELTEHQMSLVHQQVKQQLVKKGKHSCKSTLHWQYFFQFFVACILCSKLLIIYFHTKYKTEEKTFILYRL